MMVVKTRIALSSDGEPGIFAAGNIHSDTAVWIYHEPVDYSIMPSAATESKEASWIDRVGWRRKDCIEVPGDAAIFWHHSDTPNCVVERGNKNKIVAARDIPAGEELTIDSYAIGRRNAKR